MKFDMTVTLPGTTKSDDVVMGAAGQVRLQIDCDENRLDDIERELLRDLIDWMRDRTGLWEKAAD